MALDGKRRVWLSCGWGPSVQSNQSKATILTDIVSKRTISAQNITGDG